MKAPSKPFKYKYRWPFHSPNHCSKHFHSVHIVAFVLVYLFKTSKTKTRLFGQTDTHTEFRFDCLFVWKQKVITKNQLVYPKMSPFKVTVFLAVGLCLFTNYINAEEAKDNAEDGENVIKVYKRLIPADVLRGLCIFKQKNPSICFYLH